MSKTHRVASKDAIKHLNKVAARRNYNRQLSTSTIRKLDPDGVNVLAVALIHEHAEGKLVDPHYRCFVFLKFTDDAAPHRAMLDVPMDEYDALTTVDQYKRRQLIEDLS